MLREEEDDDEEEEMQISLTLICFVCTRFMFNLVIGWWWW